MLVGEPGTAKSMLSELFSAAISANSQLTIQGTAGTTEDHIKYSWNYALLLSEGPTDKSYGINVANLAELPKGLIERAKKILKDLEFNHQKLSDDTSITLFNFDDFEEEEVPLENEIIKELKDVSVDELTPLEALNLLHKIVNKL